MTNYNINLLHTVIHKFTGLQLYPGNEAQAFAPDESIPEESIVDVSIQSTFVISQPVSYLQTHFQLDDIRLPEEESQVGYRLKFCLFALFEVKDTKSEADVKEFSQRFLPNILAPLVSDNHSRFVSILQPGIVIPRLQSYISPETIEFFIEQNKIAFQSIQNQNGINYLAPLA